MSEMDMVEIGPVYREMDVLTREFLRQISQMLHEQFAEDVSRNYLHKMVLHLQTFYEDVKGELQEKKRAVLSEIEGILTEAKDLQRALNVNFEISNNDDQALPLAVYLKRIDQDLEEMRELYSKRKQEIDICLAEQEELCGTLGEHLRSLPLDPLPTESEVQEFQLYLVELKKEKLRRENEINCFKNEIANLCEELELAESSSVVKHFSPTKDNLKCLQEEVNKLRHQRETIKRECQQILKQLELLWDCLEESAPAATRNAANVYNQTSLQLLEAELKRCKQLKQDNIKMFVDKIRIQIVAQWDKIYKSEEERKKFTYMYSTVYTDDLLSLHEIELEECKKFYEENHLIFEKFEERNGWWEKMLAFEARQNEPGRYNNRGGQLLREEKERKQLNMKLPEIEEEIRKLVEDYQERTNREFLVNGVEITTLIAQDWENMRNTKEQLKSARKATTNILTPSHRGVATPKTPMSMRGQTTMKRLASTTNLATASGNTGKKILLEVPNRGNNVTTSARRMEVGVVSRTPGSNRNQTKRNLMTQLNSPTDFAKPIGSAKSFRKPVKVMATLGVPTLSLPRRRSNGLNNISSKIVKKYRLSNSRRRSRISATTTDESLINYDIFENQMKNSQFTNSSVVEQQENMRQNQQRKLTKTTTTSISHTRTILRTPNRNNTINTTRSPVLSGSAKKLKTKNLGIII